MTNSSKMVVPFSLFSLRSYSWPTCVRIYKEHCWNTKPLTSATYLLLEMACLDQQRWSVSNNLDWLQLEKPKLLVVITSKNLHHSPRKYSCMIPEEVRHEILIADSANGLFTMYGGNGKEN